jgi:hypothetical protein
LADVVAQRHLTGPDEAQNRARGERLRDRADWQRLIDPHGTPSLDIREPICRPQELPLAPHDEHHPSVPNENLKLSTKNLPFAQYTSVHGLNVYDILKHDTLVLSQAAATALNERMA